MLSRKRSVPSISCGVMVFILLCAFAPHASAAQTPGAQNYSAILHYISSAWSTLTRSMTECGTVHDPKLPGASDLYFPSGFAIPPELRTLSHSCAVRLAHLPRAIHHLGGPPIQPAGLLYLPHAYVVPGGMFNEMYGWDSYFILLGLLEGGKLDLARGMTENFFFEISHYGAVLNANRTYYLTRSQPPFLSEMARAVYEAERARGRNGQAWLREAYPFIVRTEQFWTQPPNLAGATGLSRYFDFGEGPAPELGKDSDMYYRHAASYFVSHPGAAAGYLVSDRRLQRPSGILGPLFPVYICNPEGRPGGEASGAPKGCEEVEKAGLTPSFYKGDRSLRESGFDITFKFGPFGNATNDYAALGLNCLLYREEEDLAWMSRELHKPA
ncbi:MAG: trehalase, partial [Acidobacteriota bacterium]|nr:trehalase [Acidobacteriota bacterium]